jgi:histidyl-tRNA synthetase
MLSWIIQITIISIVLIFLIHHIINFLKSTLTIPKIKDLVNIPMQKYENMYNIINNSNHENNTNEYTNKKSKNYTLIDLLPQNEEIDMKNELKNFLKSQLNNINTDDKTEFVSLDSNQTSYSNY